MAYLVTQRRIAFGTYTSPRAQARRRAPVRFEGHYGMQWIGLGSLGAADWSGFISILQGAILPSFPPLPIGRIVMQQILGTYTPSPSQITPAIANQLILALGNFKLSGQAGAYRDALWTRLQQYVASPPQLPAPPAPAAPAPPVGAPVGPAPIVAPAAPAAGGLPASAYAGTPVPVGFLASQIFVDANGHQWMYNQAAGIFQDATAAAMSAATASEQAQAAQIAAATATSPGGPESPTLVTSPIISPALPQQGGAAAPVSVSVTSGSSYSDILNWLGERTLVSFAPNWAILAGVGFLALKLSGKKGLL